MHNKKKYRFNLKLNEFNEWICSYDLIPGLIGVGDTMEEAIKEAKIFLKQYLYELESNN